MQMWLPGGTAHPSALHALHHMHGMHTVHTVESLRVQLTGDEEANSNAACQPPGSLQRACRCGRRMLRVSMKRTSTAQSDAG